MLIVAIQTIAVTAAGYALLSTWRWLRQESYIAALLVAVGLIGRSIAGQMMFWISYLNLDIARPLQVGNGIWFFALDSLSYYGRAVSASAAGLIGVIHMSRSEPSPAYAQVLALGVLLFGTSVAVAILLNIAAYLGICALLIRIGPKVGLVTPAAVGAITFSPSLILWSLQPLKDVFFALLLLSSIALGREWLRESTVTTPRFGVQGLLAAALFACFFALASIRFYIGPIMLVALAPLLVASVWRSPRRAAASISCTTLAAILWAAIELGAGPFLPEPMRLITGRSSLSGSSEHLVRELKGARASSERLGGGTLIGAGPRLAEAKNTVGQRTRRVIRIAEPNAESSGASKTPIVMPTSSIRRLLTGAAAVTLPRFMAQPLDLVRVGGGRGFMWFVDVDTVVFDLTLVGAVLSVWRQRSRRPFLDPVMWLVLIYTITLGVLLSYTVSNYGTLFRQRSMVYVVLVAIPVLAGAALAGDGKRPGDEPIESGPDVGR